MIEEEEAIEALPVPSGNRPNSQVGPSKSRTRSRKKDVEIEAEEVDAIEGIDSQAPMSQAPPSQVEFVDDREGGSKPLRKVKGRPTKGRGKPKVEPEAEIVVQKTEEEENLPIEYPSETIRSFISSTSKRSQPSQHDSRPLSQLEQFANIPPSSPVIASTLPKSRLAMTKSMTLPRDVLDLSVHEGAIQARNVIEDLARESERGLKEPLSDEQKTMTLEELVRSEMTRRYEAMEREGEYLIGKWTERTEESRRRIQAV